MSEKRYLPEGKSLIGYIAKKRGKDSESEDSGFEAN